MNEYVEIKDGEQEETDDYVPLTVFLRTMQSTPNTVQKWRWSALVYSAMWLFPSLFINLNYYTGRFLDIQQDLMRPYSNYSSDDIQWGDNTCLSLSPADTPAVTPEQWRVVSVCSARRYNDDKYLMAQGGVIGFSVTQLVAGAIASISAMVLSIDARNLKRFLMYNACQVLLLIFNGLMASMPFITDWAWSYASIDACRRLCERYGHYIVGDLGSHYYYSSPGYYFFSPKRVPSLFGGYLSCLGFIAEPVKQYLTLKYYTFKKHYQEHYSVHCPSDIHSAFSMTLDYKTVGSSNQIQLPQRRYYVDAGASTVDKINHILAFVTVLKKRISYYGGRNYYLKIKLIKLVKVLVMIGINVFFWGSYFNTIKDLQIAMGIFIAPQLLGFTSYVFYNAYSVTELDIVQKGLLSHYFYLTRDILNKLSLGYSLELRGSNISLDIVHLMLHALNFLYDALQAYKLAKLRSVDFIDENKPVKVNYEEKEYLDDEAQDNLQLSEENITNTVRYLYKRSGNIDPIKIKKTSCKLAFLLGLYPAKQNTVGRSSIIHRFFGANEQGVPNHPLGDKKVLPIIFDLAGLNKPTPVKCKL